MRRIIVGVLALLFLTSAVVVRAQPLPAPDNTMYATAPLQLHESPPRRPLLFPFVVLPPRASGTIDEGTTFMIRGEEARNDFLQEPSKWLYIETPDGMSGWVNVGNSIAWTPYNSTDVSSDALARAEEAIAEAQEALEILRTRAAEEADNRP